MPQLSGSGNDNLPYREVRYEYSPGFPNVLKHLRASLLISTYQAGKLVAVGVQQDKLAFSFHQFDRAMGIAVNPRRMAVGTRRHIISLIRLHEMAGNMQPPGTYDDVWLSRSAITTGNIHSHEIAWGDDGLWVVNTLFSALCTLEESFSFVPRWKPPFISELAAQDRCHLNGLAMQNGRPKYVTVMGESDRPAGWRENKATGGCLIDVESGETVCRGLCMPHSPRVFADRLWVLDSGTGTLRTVEPKTGRTEVVESFPGYTRGLAFMGQFAFVGLSKIRETSVFGGVPIAEKRHALRCGVGVVDLVAGKTVAVLQFHSGVDEVFALDVIANSCRPYISGPNPESDSQQEVWVVPPTGTLVSHTAQTLFHGTDGVAESAAEPLAKLARSLQSEGDPGGAVEAFQQALALEPQRADLLSDLGNAWQELNDQEAALECYRQAIAVDPDFIPARQNLGYLLMNHGEPEQAIEHYEWALRVRSTPITEMLAATILPVIYDSRESVEWWRGRLANRVHRLAEEGLVVETSRSQIPTNFFLAYQGKNDRDVAADLGRIYRGITLCEPALDRGVVPRSDARLRIGWLSAYFRDHTIGRLNLGRIRRMDRKRFEVTVLSAAPSRDAMATAFAQAADRFVSLPRRVELARQMIADQDLDVLIFADSGMDSITSTLVFSRMAPVQCVTFGHPDTTGSPAADYFLSSELLEVPDADSHYTEKLVRLPSLGTYYERVTRSGNRRSRVDFGLDDNRRIYLCPQTLFKFHPEFDELLARILAGDPDGDLVILEGRIKNWTERLKRRFARTLPDSQRRVRFIPAQQHDDYLALLELSEVVLDPLHFGGGNSTYEALAMGTPVVTLPSQYLRGRVTRALYAKMGLAEEKLLVTSSSEEYVSAALTLGTNSDARREVTRRIHETSPVLFEDPQEVLDLEAFLWSLVR